jgi:hypothetical protein
MRRALRAFGRVVIAGCLVGGFWLGSYGVLRESFAEFATPSGTGLGHGGLGHGGLGGGGLSALEQRAVAIGTSLGLLPAHGRLDGNDRRRNAAAAIVGFALLAVPTAREVWKMLRGR